MRRPLTGWTLCAALVGAAVILWALPRLLPVLFVAALAGLFALALDAPVRAIHRRGIKRGVAAVVVLLTVLATFGGLAYATGPSVLEQFAELTAGPGDSVDALVLRVNEATALLPGGVPPLTADAVRAWIEGNTSRVGSALAGVGGAFANVVLALVVATFAVSRPEVLHARALRFIPPARREQVCRVSAALERKLRRWIVGQLALMAAVGVGCYIVFRATGVPFPELFAVLAAVLEAVPLLGVLLASVGPVVLLSLQDPTMVPWLLLGIVVVQQFEDRLLVPRIVGRAVELPEVLVMLWVLGAGLLFGLGGMVLATPMLAAVVTAHDDITASRERE
jgi:predicted PurR-regulated permease PerM